MIRIMCAILPLSETVSINKLLITVLFTFPHFEMWRHYDLVSQFVISYLEILYEIKGFVIWGGEPDVVFDVVVRSKHVEVG